MDEELTIWIKQYTNSIARMSSFPSYFPNLLDIPGWVGFIDCLFFLLLYVAYADTSGTCSMLPRDKGGVVDSQLKVSKRMDSPAYVCTRTANLICRCTEHTTCASLIFPSSRCTSMFSPRVRLVSSRHATPFHALILWLRRFPAYVYAMAEQGGSSISFLFFADLCFPALLVSCSIRYYQRHHLNCDQNLAGRLSYTARAFSSFFLS